jgi:hypothetical protein
VEKAARNGTVGVNVMQSDGTVFPALAPNRGLDPIALGIDDSNPAGGGIVILHSALRDFDHEPS